MSIIRINKNPTGRQLFVFSMAWLVFLGSVALADWRHGRPRAAEALGIAAAALPLAGLASRSIPRYAFLGLSYLTYPIGLVLSHVALGVVYYLALTPVGLTMRAMGRDPLERKFKPDEKTYWIPRTKARTVQSYFKQD
jgi:ABC-type uncharacterized transport system permease subunit